MVLLVQPCDDGLHMDAEYLCEYGRAVIAVSEAWDALIAAPKADVIRCANTSPTAGDRGLPRTS
jgi:hypothetical protein